MSGVSTKISVFDAATPAIEHMYRGVSQLISGMYKLNEATKNSIDISPFLEAQKSMAEAMAVQKQLANGMDNIGEEYKQIKNYTEQANNAQRQYNNSLSQGINSATAFGDRLTSGIKRGITMAAGAYGGKQLIDASDTWTNNSARLGLITDNLQQQKVLQEQIYRSAKNARGVYGDTVDVVAKLGLLAGDAFESNSEAVKFTELMNKSFKLSGASNQEKSAAMYQLTQAMSSGRLQGDEFRSIIENAPMLANAIGEYTGVGREGLKELSSDGAISAEIIKNSLFMAADDIENKFSTLPMNFGDVWTNITSDATTAFAPVFEQMNDMLNSDIVQGVVLEIPNLFEEASLRAQELLSVMEGAGIVAGPGLSNIADSAGDIANAIFSANGVAGNFIRTIGQIGANPATNKSIQTLGGGFITVAGALNSILQVATPLMPIITQGYVAFKMYNTVYPILNNVATGVVNVAQNTHSMITALNSAKTAQEGLNTAMTANPYLTVASAIAKVIAMMVSLIGTIKAVNNAADLAEESNSEYSYENIKKANEAAERNNVDNKTANQLVTAYDTYQTALEDNDKARQNAYDKWFKDNHDTFVEVGYRLNLQGEELEQYMIENATKTSEKLFGLYDITQQYDKNQNNLYNNFKEEHEGLIEAYNQKMAAKNTLNNISDDPNDYYKEFDGNFDGNLDVDNVNNVNHINDTVDIASEDLRYLRELADQEAINMITNKMLQPQINVTFGEVKETADVDEITRRITDGLVESLNNSSDLVHI